MWGKSTVTLAMVDSARRAGTDVMIDQYPYTASHTGIDILMPPWALAGGDSALSRRLNDPVLHDSIEAGVIDALINDRGGGDLQARAVLARVRGTRRSTARRCTTWSLRLNVEPTIENAAPIVIDVGPQGRRARRSSTCSMKGREADHGASADDDRQRRPAEPAGRRRPAPARLRHVPARVRQVRARGEGAHAGAGGAAR